MAARADTLYLSQLRKALSCPKAEQEHLLQKFTALLEGYCQENPAATYEDIVSSFGPPDSFAGELLKEVDSKAVEQCKTKQRRRPWLVAGICIAAAVAMVGFVLWFLSEMPVFQVIYIGTV